MPYSLSYLAQVARKRNITPDMGVDALIRAADEEAEEERRRQALMVSAPTPETPSYEPPAIEPISYEPQISKPLPFDPPSPTAPAVQESTFAPPAPMTLPAIASRAFPEPEAVFQPEPAYTPPPAEPLPDPSRQIMSAMGYQALADTPVVGQALATFSERLVPGVKNASRMFVRALEATLAPTTETVPFQLAEKRLIPLPKGVSVAPPVQRGSETLRAAVQQAGDYLGTDNAPPADPRLVNGLIEAVKKDPEVLFDERFIGAYLGDLVAQQAPIMGSIIAASLANPALGVLAAGAMEGGSFYEQAIKEGASAEDAARGAAMVGAINAGLEYVPVHRLLVMSGKAKPLSKFHDSINEFVKNSALREGTRVRMALDGLAQGQAEGMTEFFQEAVSTAARSIYDDRQSVLQALTDQGNWESYIAGTLLGMPMGMVASPGTDQRRREQQAKDKEDDARADYAEERSKELGTDYVDERLAAAQRRSAQALGGYFDQKTNSWVTGEPPAAGQEETTEPETRPDEAAAGRVEPAPEPVRARPAAKWDMSEEQAADLEIEMARANLPEAGSGALRINALLSKDRYDRVMKRLKWLADKREAASPAPGASVPPVAPSGTDQSAEAEVNQQVGPTGTAASTKPIKQPPVAAARPVTMNVNGRLQTAQLTSEQATAWDQEQQDHDQTVASLRRNYANDRPELVKALKGQGMRHAARQREIAGLLTTKEKKAAEQARQTLQVGRTVSVAMEDGTTEVGAVTQAPVYGMVKVALPSRGDVRVPAASATVVEEPAPTASQEPRGEAIASTAPAAAVEPPVAAQPTPAVQRRPLRDALRDYGGIQWSPASLAEYQQYPKEVRSSLTRAGVVRREGRPAAEIAAHLARTAPELGVKTEADLLAATSGPMDSEVAFEPLTVQESTPIQESPKPTSRDTVIGLRDRATQAPDLSSLDEIELELADLIERGQISPAMQAQAEKIVGREVEGRRRAIEQGQVRQTVDRVTKPDLVPPTVGEEAGVREPISTETARRTNVPVDLPTDEAFLDAVKGTPKAEITPDGLKVRVVRYQSPNQEGTPSLRSGTFYLPEGVRQTRYYKDPIGAYGGAQKVAGEVTIRRPLFVRGATGGQAPKAAYNQILGNPKSYDRLHEEVLKTFHLRSWKGPVLDGLESYLESKGFDAQSAAETAGAIEAMHADKRGTGNRIPMAIVEAVVGNTVRVAGYDAVVGYGVGRNGQRSISEIFDVREVTYPGPFEPEGELHPSFKADQPAVEDNNLSLFGEDAVGVQEEAGGYAPEVRQQNLDTFLANSVIKEPLFHGNDRPVDEFGGPGARTELAQLGWHFFSNNPRFAEKFSYTDEPLQEDIEPPAPDTSVSLAYPTDGGGIEMRESPAYSTDVPGLVISPTFEVNHAPSGYRLHFGDGSYEVAQSIVAALGKMKVDWSLDKDALTKAMTPEKRAQLSKVIKKAINETKDQQVAAMFSYKGASGFGQGSQMMKVHVNITNPLDLRDLPARNVSPKKFLESLAAKGITSLSMEDVPFSGRALYQFLNDSNVATKIRTAAIEQGYDGVIFKDYYDDKTRGDSYIAFNAEQIKSATGNRGTFDPNEPSVLREGADEYAPDAPVFFSAVQRAADKLPKRASAQQILATISKTPGVKQEEIEDLGLREWLEGQDGPIDKAAALDFIETNSVKVEEVVHDEEGGVGDEEVDALTDQLMDQEVDSIIEDDQENGRGPDPASIEERDDGWAVLGESVDDVLDTFDTMEEARDEADRINERMDEEYRTDIRNSLEYDNFYQQARAQLEEETGGNLKYDEYQMEGPKRGSRELLITLPSKWKQVWEVNKQRDERGGRSDVVASYGTEAEASADRDRRRAAGETVAVFSRTEQIGGGPFTGAHWSEPNVLVHIRFNERTDADGKRVLFVEEVQSDWNQAGREKGYGDQIEDTSDPNVVMRREVVPIAPMKNTQTWMMLGMKRAIRWAAENGFDRVAWTPGEVQAERYDLSTRIDSIEYSKRPDGTYYAIAVKDNSTLQSTEVDGKSIDAIAEMFGKEVARRIEAGEGTPQGEGVMALFGDHLSVGGAAMEAFYDRMLPNEVNKYVKKWGAKVGTTKIQVGGGAGVMNAAGKVTYVPVEEQEVWSLDLTPAMKEAVLQVGQPLYENADRYEADRAPRAPSDYAPGEPAVQPTDEQRQALFEAVGDRAWLIGMVELVGNHTSYPLAVRARMEDMGIDPSTRDAAWMDGKVYLNAELLEDPQQIRGKILHEVGIHLGLRRSVGPERMKVIGTRIWKSLSPLDRMEIASLHGLELAPSEAGEEWLGREAERFVDEGPTRLWDRIVAMVNRLLRTMGFDRHYSDAEIAGMVRQGMDAAESGTNDPEVIAEMQQLAMDKPASGETTDPRDLTRLEDIRFSAIPSKISDKDYSDSAWAKVNNYLRTSTNIVVRLLHGDLNQVAPMVPTRVVRLRLRGRAAEQSGEIDDVMMLDDWLNSNGLKLTAKQRRELMARQSDVVSARDVQVALGIAQPPAAGEDSKALERAMSPKDLFNYVYQNREQLFALRDRSIDFAGAAERFGFVPKGKGAALRAAIAGKGKKPLQRIRAWAASNGISTEGTYALEDLMMLRLDVDPGEKQNKYLGENSKTGAALDFPIWTCHPSAACVECYAATAYMRASSNRAHVRNLIALLEDPKGFADKVAAEVKAKDRTQLKFLRFFGSGDLSTTEQVTAFNEIARQLDRPMMIFSRHHHNLRKLKNGPGDAVWFKMGSIDRELIKTYGVKYLANNAKHGIVNAWLFSNQDEIPMLDKLDKAGALGVILPASHELYKQMPQRYQMSNCPCDAKERGVQASCQRCGLSSLGCFMGFQTMAVRPDGTFTDIRTADVADGDRLMAQILPPDNLPAAWAQTFVSTIERGWEQIEPSYHRFRDQDESGNLATQPRKNTIVLKDLRRTNSDNDIKALRLRLQQTKSGWTVFGDDLYVDNRGRPAKGGKVTSTALQAFSTEAEARRWATEHVKRFRDHLRSLQDAALKGGTMYFHGIWPAEGGIHGPVALSEGKLVVAPGTAQATPDQLHQIEAIKGRDIGGYQVKGKLGTAVYEGAEQYADRASAAESMAVPGKKRRMPKGNTQQAVVAYRQKMQAKGYIRPDRESVRSIGSLAVFAQAWRDPRVEHLRYVFINLDTGDPIAVEHYSSSEVNGVQDSYFEGISTEDRTRREMAANGFSGEWSAQDEQRYRETVKRNTARMADRIKRMGKSAGTGNIGVIVLHNHPTGDSTPSTWDMNATTSMADKFRLMGVNFIGHVIINSNEYSFIKPDIMNMGKPKTKRYRLDGTMFDSDPTERQRAEAFVADPLRAGMVGPAEERLGGVVGSRVALGNGVPPETTINEIANLGVQLKRDENYVTVFGLDAKSRVVAVYHVHVNEWTKTDAMKGFLANRQTESGSFNLMAYYDGTDATLHNRVRLASRELIQKGPLTEHIFVDPNHRASKPRASDTPKPIGMRAREGAVKPTIEPVPSVHRLNEYAGEYSLRNLKPAERQRRLMALETAERMADQLGVVRSDRLMVDEVGANEKIRMATGWFKGIDGRWRYEIDDEGMRVKQRAVDNFRKATVARASAEEPDFVWPAGQDLFNGPLSSLIDHPALFAAYPQLKNIQVKYGVWAAAKGADDMEGTYISPAGGDDIWLYRDMEMRASGGNRPAARRALLHEIQHAIQYIEGFAPGSSPNAEAKSGRAAELNMAPIEAYDRSAGEIEAVASESPRDTFSEVVPRQLAQAGLTMPEEAIVDRPEENAEGPEAIMAWAGVPSRRRQVEWDKMDFDDRMALAQAYRERGGGPRTPFKTSAAGDRMVREGADAYDPEALLDSTGKPVHPTPEGQQAFKQWFVDSKTVDDNGRPLLLFSGHGNVELYGDRYSPRRGKAGGFYASESPDIGSLYALQKVGNFEDTEVPGDQYRFRLKNGKWGKRIWQMKLDGEQQAAARDYLENIGYDLEKYWEDNKRYDKDARRALVRGGLQDLQSIFQFLDSMGENIAYDKEGNDPRYLRQQKGAFQDLLDRLGIEWQSYDWEQPGVMPVYMRITNPIDASEPFPADVLSVLKKAASKERVPAYTNDEHWRKTYSLSAWVRDIESGSEYWSTQIPSKALPILQAFGYDGVKELGSKGGTDGPRQVNWIAFSPEQIKSATGNRGTFSSTEPSMLKEEGGEYRPDYRITGEYWIKGGDIEFADGDVGDQSHESIASQEAMSRLADDLGIHDDDPTDEQIKEVIGFDEEAPRGSPADHSAYQQRYRDAVKQALEERGYGEDAGLVDVSHGNGDPRKFAMENWGWIRLAGNNLEMQELTPQAMREAANGINQAIAEQEFEEAESADPVLTIYVSGTDKTYQGVPLSVLQSGRPGAMRDYDTMGEVREGADEYEPDDFDRLLDQYLGPMGPEADEEETTEAAPVEGPLPGDRPPAGQRARRTPISLEKAGMVPGDNLFYTRVADKNVTAEAKRAMADKGVERIQLDLMDPDIDPSALNTALGISVIAVRQATAEKLMAKADGIEDPAEKEKVLAQAEEQLRGAYSTATHLAERATSLGQEVSAFRLMSRLTPATVLFYANREIDKINRGRSQSEQKRKPPRKLERREYDRLNRLAKELDDVRTVGDQAGEMGNLVDKLYQGGEMTPEDIDVFKQLAKSIQDAIGTVPEPVQLTAEQRMERSSDRARALLVKQRSGAELTKGEVRFLDALRQRFERATEPVPEKAPRDPSVRRRVQRKTVNDLVGERLSTLAEGAKARMRERGYNIGMAAGDPGLIYDFAIILAQKMHQKATPPKNWREEMIAEFGQVAEDNADAILKAARGRYLVEHKRATRIHRLAGVSQQIIERLEADFGIDEGTPRQSTTDWEEAKRSVQVLAYAVDQMKELSGEAQAELAMEIQAVMGGLTKPSWGRKMSNLVYMSDLGNTRPQIRNIIGNELMWRAERMGTAFIATPMDLMVSKLTGTDRQITFKRGNQTFHWLAFIQGDVRGQFKRSAYWSGLARGMKAGWKGVAPADLLTGYEIPEGLSFRGKGWIQKATEALIRHEFETEVNLLGYWEKATGAALRGFDYAAYSRAKAAHLGMKGEIAADRMQLKGEEREAFLVSFVQNADAIIANEAREYGKWVTFQDRSAMAKGALAVKKAMQRVPLWTSKKDGAFEFTIADVVLKYAMTPANLTDRAFNYSPIGLMHAFHAWSRPYQKMTTENTGIRSRAEVEQHLTRTLMGLGGWAMAWTLYKYGVLTGPGDDDDDTRTFKKEQTGEGRFQVNASAMFRLANPEEWAKAKGLGDILSHRDGDTLYSIDWMAPLSITMAMALGAKQGWDEAAATGGKAGQVGSALAAGAKGAYLQVADLSMIRSLSGLFRGGTERIPENILELFERFPARMLIPSFLGALRATTDNVARETYDRRFHQRLWNNMKDRFPGLSQSLPERWKTYGRDQLEKYPDDGNDFLSVFLSPGFSAEYKMDPMVAAILRPVEEADESTGIPRTAYRRGRLVIGARDLRIVFPDREFASSVTFDLTGRDLSLMRQMLAKYATDRMEQIDLERMPDSPYDQAKVFYQILNGASEDARRYFLENLAAKYLEMGDASKSEERARRMREAGVGGVAPR